MVIARLAALRKANEQFLHKKGEAACMFPC